MIEPSPLCDSTILKLITRPYPGSVLRAFAQAGGNSQNARNWPQWPTVLLRRRFRMRFAAMARITGDLFRAIEGVDVDPANHFQHFAGNYLFVLFVAAEIAFHMAIDAPQSRPRYERLHHSTNFFRLDHLQISRRRHASPSAPRTDSGRGRVLSQQSYCSDRGQRKKTLSH
jgi:hypothetical protein